MSEFRATNEIPIRPMQDGGIDMHGFYISEQEMQALQEFFQAERDEESGCFIGGCCFGDRPPVPSQQDAAEAALTTAHIDEIAQRVVALLKERL